MTFLCLNESSPLIIKKKKQLHSVIMLYLTKKSTVPYNPVLKKNKNLKTAGLKFFKPIGPEPSREQFL